MIRQQQQLQLQHLKRQLRVYAVKFNQNLLLLLVIRLWYDHITIYNFIHFILVCKDEWWCRWRPQWTCNYLPMLKNLCPKKCGACEEESTTSTTTTTTTTATTPESCKDKFDFWCRMNFWRCRFSRGIRSNCPSTCGLC